MADYSIKHYAYRCSCGFSLAVFVDAATPQETARCRLCSSVIRRELVT